MVPRGTKRSQLLWYIIFYATGNLALILKIDTIVTDRLTEYRSSAATVRYESPVHMGICYPWGLLGIDDHASCPRRIGICRN